MSCVVTVNYDAAVWRHLVAKYPRYSSVFVLVQRLIHGAGILKTAVYAAQMRRFAACALPLSLKSCDSVDGVVFKNMGFSFCI